MDHEFEINTKLKRMEMASKTEQEDRKDKREEKKSEPKFESSGNDVMGQGLDMDV